MGDVYCVCVYVCVRLYVCMWVCGCMAVWVRVHACVLDRWR